MKIMPASIDEQINRVDRQRSLTAEDLDHLAPSRRKSPRKPWAVSRGECNSGWF
jgi:hypothetical protein